MIKQNPAHFILASILSACPKTEQFEEIRILSPVLGESPAEQELIGHLAAFTPESLMDLHSDYIDLFDRGHADNPIYETEYGRNRSISKTTELADLAGFYQAFGLGADGQAEMPDHLSVELEFYAWLLIKQQFLFEQGDLEGQEIVADARKKFLADHLGSFAGQLMDCPGVTSHPVYTAIFKWIGQLVSQACQEEGIDPRPTPYLPGQREAENFDCASLGGCGLASLGSPKAPSTDKLQASLEV